MEQSPPARPMWTPVLPQPTFLQRFIYKRNHFKNSPLYLPTSSALLISPQLSAEKLKKSELAALKEAEKRRKEDAEKAAKKEESIRKQEKKAATLREKEERVVFLRLAKAMGLKGEAAEQMATHGIATAKEAAADKKILEQIEDHFQAEETARLAVAARALKEAKKLKADAMFNAAAASVNKNAALKSVTVTSSAERYCLMPLDSLSDPTTRTAMVTLDEVVRKSGSETPPIAKVGLPSVEHSPSHVEAASLLVVTEVSPHELKASVEESSLEEEKPAVMEMKIEPFPSSPKTDRKSHGLTVKTTPTRARLPSDARLALAIRVRENAAAKKAAAAKTFAPGSFGSIEEHAFSSAPIQKENEELKINDFEDGAKKEDAHYEPRGDVELQAYGCEMVEPDSTLNAAHAPSPKRE